MVSGDVGGPLAERGLVKVCGLTEPADIKVAALAGADLIGLVFVDASKRFVTPGRARLLAAVPRGGAALVGLFQDPALSEIEEALEAAPLDMIQLHGAETDDAVATIRSAFGLPVIKAVGVSGPGDLYRAAGCPADMMLYDAKPPEDGRGHGAGGGHGLAFDWDVLAAGAHARPWLLAGGLTDANVADAVRAGGAFPGFAGVDVSSGVEASRGVKDARRIKRFIGAARAAMAAPTKEHVHG